MTIMPEIGSESLNNVTEARPNQLNTCPDRSDKAANSSIDLIRGVAEKMRQIRTQAYEISSRSNAQIDSHSITIKSLNKRIIQTEAELQTAIGRAERAEKLVQMLSNKLRLATQTPSKDDAPQSKSIAKPVRKSGSQSGSRELTSLSASSSMATLGSKIDIKLDDDERPKSIGSINPSANKYEVDRSIKSDFRNEKEFDDLTY